MYAFKYIGKHRTVTLQADDSYAIVTMNDGKQRRMEFYTGASYLSQSDKFMLVTLK